MLRSLEIQNYRNLRQVNIESLGQVNLLVGRNNSGKTSLLEAIAIHINQGNINFLLQLLNERGENIISRGNRISDALLTESLIVQTLSSIFFKRKPGFKTSEAILVGEYSHGLFYPELSPTAGTSIKFVKYVTLYDPTEDRNIPTRRRRVYLEEDNSDPEAEIAIQIVHNREERFLPIKNFDKTSRGIGTVPNSYDELIDNFQFVRTKNIDRDINGSLWDRISLTNSEDEVVNALKIIEPAIERITFRTERNQERVAIAKLKDSNDVIPLKSMGDGINRILTIILAMVNCEDGYLLIDEFENGLHYSVQQALWEVIFNVATRLKIQVFATTHSNDAIRAYANTVQYNYKYRDSKLIRLRNQHGDITPTVFDTNDLSLVLQQEYLDLR